MYKIWLIVAVCFSIGFAQTLHAGSLAGNFAFKKKAPKGALIYFSEDQSLSTPANVDQKNTAFVESIVVGAKGNEAIFKNSDSINHNIFANDSELGVSFDIGLAPPGSEFKQPISWESGKMIRISCKIHPKMRAWVASLTSKYHHTVTFKKKQKKVDFEIEDVPDNLSKLVVWMPGYDPIDVAIKPGETQEVKLIRKKKTRGTLTLTRK